MKQLVIIDVRAKFIGGEEHLIDLTKTITGANAFLVESHQQGAISQHFPGGAIRYVEGKHYGFIEDILCYDNEHGSFLILTISELAVRKE